MRVFLVTLGLVSACASTPSSSPADSARTHGSADSGGITQTPRDGALDVHPDAAVELPKTPGAHEIEFLFGSAKRKFILSIPDHYDDKKKVPLVFVFHGANQSAAKAATDYGIREVAAKRGVIAIFGEGVFSDSEGGRTWNAFSCCGYARISQSDDVGYVRAVLDYVQVVLQIDARRVYATGFSNGAMFTHRVGVELGDRLAAIAPVAGCLSGIPANETTRSPVSTPKRAMPVLAIHGRKDQIVPFNGGNGKAGFDSEAISTGFWATFNGCTGPAVETHPVAGVDRFTHASCVGGSEVTLIATDEGTHTYQLLEKYGTETATAVLDFFDRFTLPP